MDCVEKKSVDLLMLHKPKISRTDAETAVATVIEDCFEDYAPYPHIPSWIFTAIPQICESERKKTYHFSWLEQYVKKFFTKFEE